MKKYFVVLIGIMIGVGLLYWGLSLSAQMFGYFYGPWYPNWGVKISTPNKFVLDYDEIEGFPAEGTSYTIGEYKTATFKNVVTKVQWRELSKESREELQSWLDILDQDCMQALKMHPLPLRVGSKYYFSKKKNGNFLIVLLSMKEQRIYVIEYVE